MTNVCRRGEAWTHDQIDGVALPRLRERNRNFVLHSARLNFRSFDNAIGTGRVEGFAPDAKAQTAAAPLVSSRRPDGVYVACPVGGRRPRRSIVVAVDRGGREPKCLYVARRETHGYNGFVGMNGLREEVGWKRKCADCVEHCVFWDVKVKCRSTKAVTPENGA